MIDYSKIQMVSSASSNKLFLEGTGSFVIPAIAGVGTSSNSDPVAHNFGTDNLLYQVTAYHTGSAPLLDLTVIPWSANDGSVYLYAQINSTNLTIWGISNSPSVAGLPARTVDYTYRILVP